LLPAILGGAPMLIILLDGFTQGAGWFYSMVWVPRS